jgi:hypothetical protein
MFQFEYALPRVATEAREGTNHAAIELVQPLDHSEGEPVAEQMNRRCQQCEQEMLRIAHPAKARSGHGKFCRCRGLLIYCARRWGRFSDPH